MRWRRPTERQRKHLAFECAGEICDALGEQDTRNDIIIPIARLVEEALNEALGIKVSVFAELTKEQLLAAARPYLGKGRS